MPENEKNWVNFETELIATWIKLALLRNDEQGSGYQLRMAIAAISGSEESLKESAQQTIAEEIEDIFNEEDSSYSPEDLEKCARNMKLIFEKVNWQDIAEAMLSDMPSGIDKEE